MSVKKFEGKGNRRKNIGAAQREEKREAGIDKVNTVPGEVRIKCVNVAGLYEKLDEIKKIIEGKKIDVLGVVETHITDRT